MLPLMLGTLSLASGPARPRLDPERATDLLQRGMQQRRSGDLVRAAETLRQAVALAPDLSAARMQLGWVYYEARQYGPAREHLRLAVRLDPDHARAWGLLGRLYLATRELDRAGHALRQAIWLNPDRAQYPALLGEVYRQRGDPHSLKIAVAELERALAMNAGDAEAQHHLGLAYLQQRRLQEAAASLAAATRLAPESPEPYEALAQVERRLGRRAAADRALETFKRLRANGHGTAAVTPPPPAAAPQAPDRAAS